MRSLIRGLAWCALALVVGGSAGVCLYADDAQKTGGRANDKKTTAKTKKTGYTVEGPVRRTPEPESTQPENLPAPGKAVNPDGAGPAAPPAPKRGQVDSPAYYTIVPPKEAPAQAATGGEKPIVTPLPPERIERKAYPRERVNVEEYKTPTRGIPQGIVIVLTGALVGVLTCKSMVSLIGRSVFKGRPYGDVPKPAFAAGSEAQTAGSASVQPREAVAAGLISEEEFTRLRDEYIPQSELSVGLCVPVLLLSFYAATITNGPASALLIALSTGAVSGLLLIGGVDRRHKFRSEYRALIVAKKEVRHEERKRAAERESERIQAERAAERAARDAAETRERMRDREREVVEEALRRARKEAAERERRESESGGRKEEEE